MSPVFHARCFYFSCDCSSDLFIFQKQNNKKKVIKKKKGVSLPYSMLLHPLVVTQKLTRKI